MKRLLYLLVLNSSEPIAIKASAMFDKQTYAFLEELITTPSPVGYEAEGQKVWARYLSEFTDKVESDAYGSAVARLDTNSDVMTVMLEAHCDEIGMVVRHITDDGFIYLGRLGGSDSTIARARRVDIHTRDGRVTGVTGHVAIHLQENKNGGGKERSEEHTSELQSRGHLVCRLLLEKKNTQI